jgi:hypothetical protein
MIILLLFDAQQDALLCGHNFHLETHHFKISHKK